MVIFISHGTYILIKVDYYCYLKHINTLKFKQLQDLSINMANINKYDVYKLK